MPDKTIVPYKNPALVLELTARIYENLFSNVYIAPEVGIKRRKHRESIIDFFPDYFPE